MKRLLLVTMVLACVNRACFAQSQTKSMPHQNCRGETQFTFIAEPPFDKLIHENDPEKQIVQLDDFVAKHPKPDLLVYIYPLFYDAYSKIKNFPMVMEYTDKTLALGSKVRNNEKFDALHRWAVAYNSLNSDDAALAAKALARSNEGIEVVSKMEKPQCVDANTFEAEKKLATIYFHATAGAAAMKLKDYSAAAGSLRTILVLEEVSIPAAPQQGQTSN